MCSVGTMSKKSHLLDVLREVRRHPVRDPPAPVVARDEPAL